ncbi:hypothetical protein V7S43_003832 [Phytophthora oleae]|uniref:START domain-containing protein n=1 Tax=Phytophthora oleae TaxID=2107226 RepID=A0ABD3FY92_9STRA
MSSELQLPGPEEAHALLQDVLAYLDEREGVTASPTSVQTPGKKRRSKGYSPDYDRCRRERKKAEREALRTQVAQYETQLELLKLQKPVQSASSTWGWLDTTTEEEEKRLKAEELNHQLRGLLVQQFNVAQTFKSLISQKIGFAQRVQSVLSSCPPCAAPPASSSFSSLSAITEHLKGAFVRLRESADYVFDSASIFRDDENFLGALVCSANVKFQDPLSGPCIELLSSTPLSCSKDTAASLLWKMMLGKEVFGPNSGCYTMKTKELTQTTANFGYSVDFNASDASGNVDGVTLMEKLEDKGRSLLVWTSMMVELDGKPFFRSQGWISVTKIPGKDEECIVRMCSRLAGRHLGVQCDSDKVDVPVARKHQFMAKSRQERVQLKILERVDEQQR